MISYELATIAVSEHGYILRFIPSNLIDQALCDIAVSNDYDAALLYVPNQFKTFKLITEVLDNIIHQNNTLKIIDSLLTT